MLCALIKMYFLFLLLVTLPTAYSDSEWVEWRPRWANETGDTTRDDLLCKFSCSLPTPGFSVYSKEYHKCCTCNSNTNWAGTEIELDIEFASILGRSVVFSDKPAAQDSVYKIVYRDSDMKEVPSNLCNWDTDSSVSVRFKDHFTSIQQYWGNIVIIDLENNKIRHLPDLNCLRRLDELSLKNNNLKFISNTSFTELPRLRFIDFRYNHIQTIDPMIITAPHLNLFYAYFQHNNMTQVDMSNYLSLYPFCELNYEWNHITELVNKVNFVLNMNKTYGPGRVTVVNNEISIWPDFKELLHLTDLNQVGKLIGFSIAFGNNFPLMCDCHVSNFMSLFYDTIQKLWQEHDHVRCHAPPHLAGKFVVNVDRSDLICNVSEQKCPIDCTCKDVPSEDTLYVNCQGRQLVSLPNIELTSITTFSHHIALNVSNNLIQSIDRKSYLTNISVLDISNNQVKEIDNEIARLLENASYIDISNNPLLRQLPQMLQYHNVCARYMKHLTIECDCDSLWIQSWLRSKNCVTDKQLFNCTVPEQGLIPALDFTKSSLSCLDPGFLYVLQVMIAATILLLIIIGTIVYYFRYELLIICLRVRQKQRNIVNPLQSYDVFISFNDTEAVVSDWVIKTLVPNLIRSGYQVFQPSADIPYGTERDSEIISTLCMSRNFLCVLSDKYLVEQEEGIRSWTENEWKYGWNQFKSDRSKNIVLINFDHTSSLDVEHRQIKAFLRVGSTINFKNHHRNIMDEIHRKLGKPFPRLDTKFDCNKRKVFPHKLFSAAENCDDTRVETMETRFIEENTKTLAEPSLGAEGEGKHVRKKHEKTFKKRQCHACAFKEQETKH